MNARPGSPDRPYGRQPGEPLTVSRLLIVEGVEVNDEHAHTCGGGPDDDGECMACGMRDCPHSEPLHYHHDGCPACYFAERSR